MTEAPIPWTPEPAKKPSAPHSWVLVPAFLAWYNLHTKAKKSSLWRFCTSVDVLMESPCCKCRSRRTQRTSGYAHKQSKLLLCQNFRIKITINSYYKAGNCDFGSILVYFGPFWTIFGLCLSNKNVITGNIRIIYC